MQILSKIKISLSTFLNWCAALIIILIVSIFFSWTCNALKKSEKIPETRINFILEQKKIVLNDSSIVYANKQFISDFNKLKDSLNVEIDNLKAVKKEIDEANSKNSDSSKVLFALIGTIFALVGFFGFKSIQDLREAVSKNSIAEAKSVAQSTAKEIADFESKKISGEIAKAVAIDVATDVATKKSEQETLKYLGDKFPEYFRKWEETYKESSDEQISELLDRVNKLENPESFGIENKKLIDLQNKYQELLSFIERLRVKEIKKDVDE